MLIIGNKLLPEHELRDLNPQPKHQIYDLNAFMCAMKETLFSVAAGLKLFKIKCRTSSYDVLNYNTISTLRLSGSLLLK